MKLFFKKLFERNKTRNYTLFHSGEKTSFLTESFYFHLKGSLTSSAYRRYFKYLFHKSAWAFLGLISEAHIILSKAITLVQSDYPYPEFSASALKLISLQLPHFILECLICTNENMWEPFVLAHIIFCSAQKNQEQFHYRHNNGHCACEPHGSSSLLYLQPHTHSSRENQPSQWGCFGLSSRRSAANQTHRILLLKRGRAAITTKSLFCYDRAGKWALGIFSTVIKSHKHKT